MTPRRLDAVRGLGLAVVLAATGACDRDVAGVGAAIRSEGSASSTILVVADTLRADHLGVYGHDRPTSPHLDAWAREGRVYERAFATSPWTLPSFGSLYTGRWPAAHRAGLTSGGGWWKGSFVSVGGFRIGGPSRLTDSVPTLAERLRDEGFATGAVMNNPYLDPSFGLARGFDVYDHVPGDNASIRRADVMVERALSLLDRWGDRPFFLVLHLFDAHMDYDPPESVRGRFTAGHRSRFSLPVSELDELRRPGLELTADDVSFLRAAYDEEIAFIDQQLAVLREGLAARALLETTLVVFTSDHGEELFDHGRFEHGHALWQEVVAVPFVVWGPGVRPGRETGVVSLVDVVPTVLDWSDLPVPTGLDGRSLWSNLTTLEPLPRRAVFVEGLLHAPSYTTVVRWPLKMTVSPEDDPLSLYDLERDPEERRDVLPSRETAASALSADLHGHRQATTIAQTGVSDEPAAPDREIMDRLRSLGYVR